jgi:hypothetical protein
MALDKKKGKKMKYVLFTYFDGNEQPAFKADDLESALSRLHVEFERAMGRKLHGLVSGEFETDENGIVQISTRLKGRANFLLQREDFFERSEQERYFEGNSETLIEVSK